MKPPPTASEQLAIAHAHFAVGKKKEGLALLRELLDKHPDHIKTLYTLSHFVTREEAPALIQQAEACVGGEPSAELHFALGNLYHRIEQYEPAYNHYSLGNQIKRIEVPSTARRYRQHVETLLQSYTAERVKEITIKGSESDLPIFVLGISRGGKSLVEHFLAQHPDVHDAKELNLVAPWLSQPNKLPVNPYSDPYALFSLEQEEADQLIEEALSMFLEGANKPRYVAITTPANHRYLPLLAVLFPKAKVIHCKRDRADQCLQMYFTCYRSGNSHAYSWDDLHSYYDCYERMMNRWREIFPLSWLEVEYEELVRHPESIVSNIYAFTDLNDADVNLVDFFGEPLTDHEIGLSSRYESLM